MQVTTLDLIGTANSKSAVNAYRKAPGDFNKAANAAAHYAKKNNAEMVIIPGNSYGSRVFHIGRKADSVSKYVGWQATVIGAIVNVDGTVYRAELS